MSNNAMMHDAIKALTNWLFPKLQPNWRFARTFTNRKAPMRNALSIHISDNPNAKETASALRVLAIFVGFDVFNEATDMIGDVPGLGDAPIIPANGGVPIPPAPIAESDLAAGAISDNPPTLDKDGLPWDERIHAGTKAVNADGSWKKRRGVADQHVAVVVAELREKYPAPSASAPAAPAAPAVPVPPAPTTPAAPAVPPAPAAAPIADGNAPPTNFGEFMRASGAFFVGNKITMADVNAITLELGYPSPIEMKKSAPNEGAGLWEMAYQMVVAKAAEK